MFAFIWAEAKDHVIGQDGKMPWHLPDDLKYFKKTTLNHTLVMGRKTFTSFGNRPLPKRKNIILTRQMDFQPDFENVVVSHDPQEILTYEQAHLEALIFVIGGAEIFQLFQPVVQRLYVTKIEAEIPGDTKMPSLPMSEFELIQQTLSQESEVYPHRFEVYQRRTPIQEKL